MRCLACGAEMNLITTTEDDTMPVAGFEHHTFMCLACGDVEQRLVFRAVGQNEAQPVHTAPPITPALPADDEHAAAVGFLRRVATMLRGE
jgi:hypothetical protein